MRGERGIYKTKVSHLPEASSLDKIGGYARNRFRHEPIYLTDEPRRFSAPTQCEVIARKETRDEPRNRREDDSRTAIHQTSLPNSLSRLCYSQMNWRDLLLGMDLINQQGHRIAELAHNHLEGTRLVDSRTTDWLDSRLLFVDGAVAQRLDAAARLFGPKSRKPIERRQIRSLTGHLYKVIRPKSGSITLAGCWI
ncbi:hypothetical protein DY000_02020971 [Brassica cretica]|uniref:Uncharacterized protein n=1 Tax=Brassica cretica TaxID=69181 RepID=A0ABQ7ECT6_BRACR|nr:hypothetical protein DY000_02020971 [Brassica cretica]